MSNKKRVCRLILTTALSNRAIADQSNNSHNTIGKYRKTLREAGLAWNDIQSLDDEEIERLLNPGGKGNTKYFVEPEWSQVHEDLAKPHVNLTMLHEEYLDVTPEDFMSEREFRRRYKKYARTLGIVLRKPRLPGENMEVDYSGKRPHIQDEAGNQVPVELFVAIIGASTRGFACVTATQKIPDFVEANVRALEYFGYCPNAVVPDNLKSAVVKYDKKNGHHINPSFERFTDHYDITVLPTMPRSPTQKANVELGVKLMQRWVLGRLRNRTFHSIEELNAAIMELNDKFNACPMKKRRNRNRNEVFDQVDAPVMRPLPRERYEYAEWKVRVRVPKDYHFNVEGNYYSVPYVLIGEMIDIRITGTSVEAYRRNKCVAVHPRSFGVDQVIPNLDHRPPNHKGYAEDQLSEALSWAEKSGPSILEFLKKHMDANQGAAAINGIKGLKRLGRDFGLDRLNNACARCLRNGAITTTSLRSMLTRGRENAPLPDEPEGDSGISHGYVRGASHYENE